MKSKDRIKEVTIKFRTLKKFQKLKFQKFQENKKDCDKVEIFFSK